MTMKIRLQNLETRRFLQSGIAWTKNAANAFDFQTIEAAQQFSRENELVHVRIRLVSCSARRRPWLSSSTPLRRSGELQPVS
jgi:hypothetical protein